MTCSLAMAAVLATLGPMAKADEPVKPLKALLITGGCCHDYTVQKNLIKKGLEARANIEVTVVEQGGRTTDTKIPLYENPNWADPYDVILHDECFASLDDPAWTQRVLAPHQKGKPAVVIHCAMHCYRDGTDAWFQFCGVTSRRHGKHYGHEVLTRDATHPIMKGGPAAWTSEKGELYWIEKVWPTAHPLASAKNKENGKEEVCVWTNNYGGTRVFGTTLGHHNETVQHPAFLDMLTRGTLWACDKLNDAQLKDFDSGVSTKQAGLREFKLKQAKVPEGFEASLFAMPPAVNYPVFVASAPDGTVYVSVDKNGSLDKEPYRGAVHRLRDVDGDGVADESKLYVSNVDAPRGLVWDRDRLYLLHPPHLSAFIDHDGDGISDEQKILVKNIAFGYDDRPGDHTSAGVTLGIDGWLYLAIGDFGFMEAEGTDGRKLQLHGGGVVRVRPDGSGLELYSEGTRNNLEVGVSPLLNMFTRDNTNDGGGWDVRLHQFTGGDDHGYPMRFKNFADEVISPLADYGGGSGCGALYMDEPGFPEGYGNAMYTADWGRQWIYRHTLTPKGASFTDKQSEFAFVLRVTDLDVDAMSNMTMASWIGAVFKYSNEDVGYLVRMKPEGYVAPPVPDFAKLRNEDLIGQLESPSHRRRLAAQRELIGRGKQRLNKETLGKILYLAADRDKPLASRVAAMFALKIIFGKSANFPLAKFTRDEKIRALAIRAMADHLDQNNNVRLEVITSGLTDGTPRVRLEAINAFSRLPRVSIGSQLANLTPLLVDPDPVVAHTAFRAMVRLKAGEACLHVIDTASADDPQRAAALRVVQRLHSISNAQAVIDRLTNETDTARRAGLITVLCRLYHREAKWDGIGWSTRPDTTGPYHKAATWKGSERIAAALVAVLESDSTDEAAFLVTELGRHRVQLPGTLKTIVAMAEDDSRLVGAAVTQLSQGKEVPEYALPLLLRAAVAEETEAVARSRAVEALGKVCDATTLPVMLHAMAFLNHAGPRKPPYERGWNAIHRNARLSEFVPLLTQIAGEKHDHGARWAEAALLVLAKDEKLDAQLREQAASVALAGWQDESRREQILRAALMANARDWKARVRESLDAEDETLRAVADKLARRWRVTRDDQPQGPVLKDMAPETVLADVLKMKKIKGGVSLGRQLYQRQLCSNCHTVRADEAPRGPYLPNVVKTYTRQQIAESILFPSKSIAQGFVTNVILLADGRVVTGFVTNEAADAVTLRDVEGREITIAKDDIDDRVEKKDSSVMPKGLVDDLTVEEFAALVEFLQSLSGK